MEFWRFHQGIQKELPGKYGHICISDLHVYVDVYIYIYIYMEVNIYIYNYIYSID